MSKKFSNVFSLDKNILEILPKNGSYCLSVSNKCLLAWLLFGTGVFRMQM